jgi:hypothetical protein
LVIKFKARYPNLIGVKHHVITARFLIKAYTEFFFKLAMSAMTFYAYDALKSLMGSHSFIENLFGRGKS